MRVQVHQISVSVQHLNLYLSHSLNHQIQLKSLNQLKISWNIFGSSGTFFGSFGTSPEVPDIFRKFRTLNFSMKFLVTLSFLPLPKLPLLPSRTPYLSLSLSKRSPSPSQVSLSLQILLLLKSPEVLQISGSLDRSACKLIIFVSIAFP